MMIKQNYFMRLVNIFLLLGLLVFSTTTHSKNFSITQKNIKSFVKLQKLFDSKAYEEAQELILKFEERTDLNNAEIAYLYNFKGNIEFANNNHEKAIEAFTKIIDNSEGVPETLVDRIKRVIFDLNKVITAESISKSNSNSKVSDLKAQLNNGLPKKDRANIYTKIALHYKNLDNSIKAVEFFAKAKKLGDEENPPAQYLTTSELLSYSELLDQNGDKLNALATLEEVHKNEPFLIEKYYKRLGQLYFDNKQFLNAANFYENAINQNLIFEDSDAAHLLLNSLLHAKQKEKAIKYADEVEKKINDNQILITLSDVYFEFEEWDKTESINLKLIKTLTSKSYDGLSWYRIGIARYHLNNLRGAKKALKKSLKKVDDKDEWQDEANQILETINSKQKN